MSANVDQRSKGQPNQVSGNPGNGVRKEDDPYLQHAPQHPIRSWSDQATDGAYGAPPMSNSNVSDSFFQSYYTPNMSYPFMNQGLSTSDGGPWSNGAESMFGMGYDYSSFYGGFGVPFNNWEYAGEYWSNPQQVRKDQRGYPTEDAYYPPEMIPADSYGMMNGAPAPQEIQEPIGTIDQGLRGMTLHQSPGSAGGSSDPHSRKKVVDISQPPVMVSDSFGGGEPAPLMMQQHAPSSSTSSNSVSSSVMGGGPPHQGGQPKKTSWAAIASQPARPQQQMRPRTIPRAPVNPNKPHNMDIGTWDMRGGASMKAPGLPVVQPPPTQSVAPPRQNWAPTSVRTRQPPAMPPHSTSGPGYSPPSNMGGSSSSNFSNGNANSNNNNSSPPSNSAQSSGYSSYSGGNNNSSSSSGGGGGGPRGVAVTPATTNGDSGDHPGAASSSSSSGASHPVLDQLKSSNLYNPKEFNLNPKCARFFVIKSYSEDDIHRSIKYNIWCSTEHGNKRLDQAFREREGKGPVYLIYSVNGSGHFCGIAQMMSPVDYNRNPGVWAQDKWKGQFEVKWVYVKDVPNSQLRHIRLENNENKPVTNSRDTQEVPMEKGKQVLRILHSYSHNTSIFDDFTHYEKRQEEIQQQPTSGGGGYRNDHRGGGGGDRGDHRGGDHRDHHRGGDHRDHHRGGDHRDHHRGDGRGDHRDHRGGGDHRGDHRGDGGRNRDNRRRQN